MLVKLTPEVNFINNLQAAFMPVDLRDFYCHTAQSAKVGRRAQSTKVGPKFLLNPIEVLVARLPINNGEIEVDQQRIFAHKKLHVLLLMKLTPGFVVFLCTRAYQMTRVSNSVTLSFLIELLKKLYQRLHNNVPVNQNDWPMISIDQTKM